MLGGQEISGSNPAGGGIIFQDKFSKGLFQIWLDQKFIVKKIGGRSGDITGESLPKVKFQEKCVGDKVRGGI